MPRAVLEIDATTAGIVAAFGQILPGEIIHGPKQGCINIHPSLLPAFTGLHTHERALAGPLERRLLHVRAAGAAPFEHAD